jgi:hypothetical protein
MSQVHKMNINISRTAIQSQNSFIFQYSLLQNELSGIYLKAGLKNVGIMFLMTDAQVPNEHFLVLINDMLASGEVPDLFADDDVENIIAGVRNEASTNIRIEYGLLIFSYYGIYNMKKKGISDIHLLL